MRTAEAQAFMADGPLRTIKAICDDYFGEGIAHVGAQGALVAMSGHWESHLRQGASLRSIAADIDDVCKLLADIRSEILLRIDAPKEVGHG